VRRIPCSSLILIALISAGALAESPIRRGQQLHDRHCTACHGYMTGGEGTTLYTRDDRLVKSLRQLQARVHYCAAGAGLDWSDADVAAVTKYLNAQYYRFGR
jgi:mono/diheme cytochrome c family protein